MGSAVWARLTQWQGSALGERLRLVYAANSRYDLGNPAGLPSAASDVLLQQAPQASSLEAVDVALAGDGVRIVMLSALDGLDDQMAGLAAGANDYLIKPFSPLQLLEMLCKRPAAGAAAGPQEAWA